MNKQYTKRWQSAPVLRNRDLLVVEGVNVRQTTLGADDLCLGDVYKIAPDARSYRLSAFQGPENCLIVSESTLLGAPGSLLHFDCNLTFISETGCSVDLCVILETDANGQIADVYFLPDSPMDKAGLYQLIRIDRTARTEASLAVVDQVQSADVLMPTHKSDKVRTPGPIADLPLTTHPK